MLEFFLVGNLSGDVSEIEVMEETLVQTEQVLANTRTEWYSRLPNWVTAIVCHLFLKNSLTQVETDKSDVTFLEKFQGRYGEHCTFVLGKSVKL